MISILFGEAVDTRTGVGPLALAADEITSNRCGAFMAGNTVTFHVRNDFAGINTLFQQFSFIL